MQSMLIAFEGLDGAGKTTLASAVARTLHASYLSTPLAELRAVRDAVDATLESPDALTLWYGAQVAAVSENARRQLAAGRDVVVDRYTASSSAWARLRGASVGSLAWIDGVRGADLTVWVEAHDEVRRRRIRARGGEHAHDSISLERAHELRTAYERALRLSESPVVYVDGAVSRAEQLRTVLRAIQLHRRRAPSPHASGAR